MEKGMMVITYFSGVMEGCVDLFQDYRESVAV